MSLELTGRIAVVTGGASGIGEACARLMAERGAKVVVADLDLARASAVAIEMEGVAIEMDVRSPASIEDAAARIEAEIGPVDILVTSAGVTQLPGSVENMTVDVWDRVQEIDLRGTFLCCAAFGKRMAPRGRGAIVTIASIAGMRSMPMHSYTPAKAAVIAMTADLAADWGRSGVRVNAVSPGFTRTPLLEIPIQRGERDPSRLIGNSALGRMVEPVEIARAVGFLVSDEATAITGINLPVDAGWLVAPSWSTYYASVPPKR